MEYLNDWRTVCKLTDADGRTRNGTQWGRGVTNPDGVKSGRGGLCGPDFYHAYHCPEIAAFLNVIHANFAAPRFWLAEIRGTVEVDSGFLKLGATEMRTVREIRPIRPTPLQVTAFGILVASATMDAADLHIASYDEWRDRWLDGIGRDDASAARSAARSAESAAWSAESAAWSAAWSAESAAWSAESAAWSAAWSAESAAKSAAARSAAARSAESILADAAVLALQAF